jgi:succinate dehydrogenase iron-sulfur subunit
VTLAPLPGFPVIRDLVVDMTQFFVHYHSIKPYVVNDEPPPERERLQSPEEREKLNGLYECILCAGCSSFCPPYWWNPDKFIGPAGLLQAQRFIAEGRNRLAAVLASGYCTSGVAAASSSIPSTAACPTSRRRYWRNAVT